ncbi:hypothetical protein DV515_00000365, partial [Chloebia gouldiae]
PSANSQKDEIEGAPNDHTNTEATQKGNLNEVHKDHMKIGASLAGVEEMQIDGSAQFHAVGGLSDHISALKEMVILPLLYPDVFEILKFKPPRGCLFYGPPGTGKTLVARALANECSRGGRKVTFFMRSAADCMSKWVGESERQLRLVFEQAYQMRPSIIFFDEIDALAPVRSSKQDQVHSSVVGTLLTLMDGLASRGEVVVIGATNRLDSIDPALRRPGRFEREFRFNLPNKESVQSGSYVSVENWDDGVDSDDDSPSVSEMKPDSKKAEFHTLSRYMFVLFMVTFLRRLHLNPSYQPTSFRPRFLLVEEPGCGQAFDLAPAILHALEKFPAYTLDLPTLFVSTSSQEETCSQLLREAQRTAPSIIYIPQIASWWEAVGPTLKAAFTGLLNNIPYFAPVLLLATSDVPHEDLPEEIKTLFNTNREEVFNIPRPTCAERKGFYENLIMKQAAEPPASKNNA